MNFSVRPGDRPRRTVIFCHFPLFPAVIPPLLLSFLPSCSHSEAKPKNPLRRSTHFLPYPWGILHFVQDDRGEVAGNDSVVRSAEWRVTALPTNGFDMDKSCIYIII